MSAFYDLASLVVVPSGYKASKVYAQKPLTTDGQLTFSRASTATRVNSAGLIETVSSNVPRLDYLGSSCPKLQLEPQRSNVITRSSEFDHSDWTKRNATITANAVTSPDGTTNADKLAEDTSNDRHDFYQGFSVTSGTTYTLSFFAKAAERTFCYASFGSSNVNAENAYFNLSTGAVVSSPAGVTSSITAYGNGWYRCVMTATASGTGVAYFVYGNSNNGTGFVYTGTTGSGTYVYGAQLEAGAYSTSLIPTTTAAVTRLADACSKTGISSLIGQTEGTIFAEFQYYDNIAVGSAQYISPLTISNGGYTEAIYFEIFNDSLNAIVFKNAALQAAITKTNLTSGTHRAALAYKQNDIAFYLDGVLVGTDSSADISSAMSQINLGTVGSSTNLDQAYTQTQALLFKTRLPNAQLAELTAL